MLYLEYFHSFTLLSDTPFHQGTELKVKRSTLSSKSPDFIDKNSNFTYLSCFSTTSLIVELVCVIMYTTNVVNRNQLFWTPKSHNNINSPIEGAVNQQRQGIQIHHNPSNSCWDILEGSTNIIILKAIVQAWLVTINFQPSHHITRQYIYY